ncbi:MAG TPA: PAS domain S-box protein [Steroidobacteraceae bacterium]|jgi:PAS domain S-box-containing protein|nr:PAS domain S-box protein [Steroidobacteraceae bacterium]
MVPARPVPDPMFAATAQLAARISGAAFACLVIADLGEVWSAADGQTLESAPQSPFPWHAQFELRSKSGESLGRLAVFDLAPRILAPEGSATLELLAAQAAAHAELRASLADLALLTGARHYEKAQRRNAIPAKALIESAPVAIYHTDAVGNMTYSNPEYRRMFGLSVGHGPDAWAERVHPEDRVRMEALWADFCSSPSPSRFDGYRTFADDGSVRHFAEQVVPAEGVAGWVGTITDLTELFNVRQDLRKAETLFGNTFDQAPIGIAFAGRDGKLFRCNESFRNMLGLEGGDFEQRTLTDFTHPDDVARVSAEIGRLWAGETDFIDLEKRYVRRDGTPLWVRMTTALVREGAGEPEYSVEYLRDISKRKQAEEELERVHKQLMLASRQAGMAEVATNVLHNVGNILNSVNISASLVTERIKQSKGGGVSRLAQLLKEKGAGLAAFIADDERGRQIPGYLASLGEQLANDQKMALEELGSLRDNLEHIKDTVAMQQSYAKLCGVTETVAVDELVEDSLRLNAGAFVRHGVTLKRDFEPVAPITVDKHKVLQILVNLVRNAKYACDESGRPDKLLTLRVRAAASGVCISVIDNGVGIAPENMARLFTHGFTTRASGHGFGLHSGALAAQELGGTLHAESDGPGRGASFILELPLVPRDRPPT